MQPCPCNPPRAPDSRRALLALASVLQTASFAARTARRVRRLRLVKWTRERRLETGSPRRESLLLLEQLSQKGGRPRLRLREGPIVSPQVAPSLNFIDAVSIRSTTDSEAEKPDLLSTVSSFCKRGETF